MDSIKTWLQQSSKPYPSHIRVLQDLEAILLRYPSLRPKAANYTYDSGQTQQLLMIDGTVPIMFRGQQYNIPINIWLNRNYPLSPPIIYVVPTNNMVIKPSKHVDNNGKVYMPYLHFWHSQPDQSNLVQMCQLLIEIFGQMPPLFAKPYSAPTSNQNPTQFTPTPQFPQSNTNPNMGHPYSNQLPQYQNPQFPSNQFNSVRSQSPNIYQQAFGNPGPGTPITSIHQLQHRSSSNQLVPNPQNQQPPQQQQQPQSQPQQYPQNLAPKSTQTIIRQQAHSQSNLPIGLTDDYTRGPIRVLPKFMGENEPHKLVVVGIEETSSVIIQKFLEKVNAQLNPDDFVFLMYYRDSKLTLQSDESPLAMKIEMYNRNELDGEPTFVIENKVDEAQAQRESLLTALSEKLHRRVYQLKANVNLEVDALVLENSDLKSREAKLLSGIEQLTNACEALKISSASLEQKNIELGQTIETLQTNTEFDVDDAIITTASIYDQLFDLVSHELAIEDTMYYLGKALDRERIDSATYIKTIRALSREQFFKKALIIKIREKLNLAF